MIDKQTEYLKFKNEVVLDNIEKLINNFHTGAEDRISEKLYPHEETWITTVLVKLHRKFFTILEYVVDDEVNNHFNYDLNEDIVSFLNIIDRMKKYLSEINFELNIDPEHEAILASFKISIDDSIEINSKSDRFNNIPFEDCNPIFSIKKQKNIHGITSQDNINHDLILSLREIQKLITNGFYKDSLQESYTLLQKHIDFLYNQEVGEKLSGDFLEKWGKFSKVFNLSIEDQEVKSNIISEIIISIDKIVRNLSVIGASSPNFLESKVKKHHCLFMLDLVTTLLFFLPRSIEYQKQMLKKTPPVPPQPQPR